MRYSYMSAQKPMLPAAFWRRLGGARSVAGEEIYEIDARAEIAAFPGPALLLGAGSKVLAANGEAARLTRALAGGGAQDMRVLVAGVAATGRPAIGQIFLPADPVTGAAQALFYLTAIALASSGGARLAMAEQGVHDRKVMILARDGSAEHAMRNALIESRDLYRDLSRCSSDFTWQTDENGAFTFVSAKGALGYSAQALNGRRSQDLLDPSVGAVEANPFITRAAVENIEIALRDAKGEPRYCRVDALPVHDRMNQWRGARGVSTDITQAKLHQYTLDFMRQRETQVRAVVDATHRTLDPAAAFCEAACIVAKAEGALFCSILALEKNQRLRELGMWPSGCGAVNPAPLPRVEQALEETPAGDNATPIRFASDGRQHQLVITSHGGARNGVIWLQTPLGAAAGTAPAGLAGGASLAQTVASHIGIAIAHDNQMRRLAELSRTDELTQLLNRRAFMEDLHLRHAHLYRAGRKGALLYADLDNLKQINDRFGHEAGDRVLKKLADILRDHSRIGDLCARLGGDEFAIWLEDTDESGAETKARHLLDESRMLHKAAGVPRSPDAPEPGLSIGIAIADPKFAEHLPQIIKRADEAMYEIKRQGKGGALIAPPAVVMENRISS